MRGASLIKKLLLIPVAIVVLLLLAIGFFEGRKAYWDYRVRGMCEKDGGVKVYETVKLPPAMLNQWGQVNFQVPTKYNAKPRDEYYFEWDVQHYLRGNPEVWRNHFTLIRAKDKKILGEAIGYSRRGGDFPGPWHESSFGCAPDADISVLKKHIFNSTDGEQTK
jgi:hypothetical protein